MKMRIGTILVIIKEYGLGWVICRMLYAIKIKLMKKIPFVEFLFEKSIDIKRINIFEISVEQLTELYSKFTMEEKRKIIQQADEACEGILTAFSSLKLDYGNPIDWHLNPLTGKKCNKEEKWFCINDFDKERGDIKVIWEASRFSQFIVFARAYMITNDLKYYNAFSMQLNDWVENNKYSYGANYKCGQECAIRMINLLLAVGVFAKYGLLDKQDYNNIEIVVEGSVKKIESNFFYAYRCIKNNHTISELVGMIIGAWCQENPKKLEKAYKLLGKVLKEQFTEDGGFCQNSFNYQRLALQMVEVVYAIKDKTGMFISKEVRERIYNSAMLLYQFQDEKTGDVPNYGSNDGALVFPLTSCGYRDFRSVINTISGLEKREFLYPKGVWEEEYLWFSNKLYKFKHKQKETKFFEKAGLYSYIGTKSSLMIIFQQLEKRPAHMDQLHIDLWINGKNVFCDSGTYSYASVIGDGMISTGGHNVVSVINKEQMKRKPPFMLYDWPGCKVMSKTENNFLGVMKSKNGYEHKRNIKYENSQISIIDEVASVENDGFEVLFHTPYKIVNEQNVYYVVDGEEKLVEIMTTGKVSVKKTYRSLYYLKLEEIQCICLSTQGTKIETKIKVLGE